MGGEVARRRGSRRRRTRAAAPWCVRSAARASCAIAFRRRTAARFPRSTRARFASCARPSPTTTVSPISRLRCRGSAAARSRSREAKRRRRAGCRAVGEGEAIPAFALSEPAAGSDVAAMTTRAVRDGGDWVLDGCKTWISNGGIADFYCVFARTGEATGARGISAFVVPADAAGLTVAERIDVIAPHPLARLEFSGCRVPGDGLVGAEGRRLQARDAHARYLSRLRRRGGSGLRAARGR